MTVTLQDMSMITALPIRGHPICRSTDTSGWRELMTDYLGMEPGIKGRATGATYGWIARNFGTCPPGLAEDDPVVETHARAYLWVAPLTRRIWRQRWVDSSIYVVPVASKLGLQMELGHGSTSVVVSPGNHATTYLHIMSCQVS